MREKIKKNKCSTCLGYGLWTWGDPSPMGQIDAREGTPTIPCPECGANANPSKLFTKNKENIDYSICKTTHFYDIVAEGKTINLKKIRKERHIDSHIIIKGLWGKSLIVIDTFDTLKDAKKEFKKI